MDSVSAPRRRPVRASRRYPSIGVRVEGGDQRRHLVPPPSLFEFDDNFGEAESSSSSTVSSLNPSDENQDESPFPSEYKFIAKSHSDKMLTGLNSLREIKQFCDVTLIVQGNEIPAHRCVLAAFSPYFKCSSHPGDVRTPTSPTSSHCSLLQAMFTTSLMEATKSHIPLQGLDYQVVRDLTEFAYSSEIQINKSNVQNLLSAANQLEVTEVRQACCRFMENHLDPSNSVGVHLFAEAYACPELQEKSKRYILRHFCEVVRNGEEFVSLPMEKLVELICSDDLEVDREETVMEAVQSWLKHDEEKRGENFEKVLEQVRLPLLSPYYLIDSVESMPVVQTNPKCRTLIEEAKVYHLLPERRRELQSARTKRRNNAGTIEVIVAVGGEDDKVVLRSVDCFDPTEVHSPSHGWRTLSCLPYALSKHGLVVSGKNMLFLAGGEYPDGTASSGFYRYDPVLDTWVELHSMTVPRSELGLAIVDGFVYAVGGWDGSHRLDSVERYDPTTNTWSFVTPLKMGMTSAAVVV
ncbi:unnamed protein product [Cyprideis torosa]|uniref:Kelch-like protein diablo n=1 Tax=Cyprideis torosa TaxID=163714 RepID=A0A7R8ZNP6_9CRUS|nr:unnamed protein product [Cyprideis torosa]CAG0896818.1 unnamed protein product [Cyprideis torosa]